MNSSGGELPNPYFYSGPVREAEGFFGRTEQTLAILNRLPKGGSTSVVGQRRSGKTSLLYHLMSHAAHAEANLDSADLVFLYLDPQLGIRHEAQFYRELVGALNRQEPSLVPALPGEVSQRRVLEITRQLQPRRLVLMIDEFERLASNRDFPMSFFSFLRGLSQANVCLITATSVRLCDCFWGEFDGSPLDNVFATEYLSSWNRDEFDAFLSETARRTAAPMLEFKRDIIYLGGHFPFYVQIACSLYCDWWQRSHRITNKDRESIALHFAEECRPYFERIWNKYLHAQEKTTLRSLAYGNKITNDSSLASLRQKGYVLDESIFSSAFRDFILQQEARKPVSAQEEHAGLQLDRKAGDVWVNGVCVTPPLTNLEYKLLLCLDDNASCICDKYDIVEAIWSTDYVDTVDDTRIAKLVSRLRNRVEPDRHNPRFIITVHGRGYKLITEPTT